MLQPMIRVIPAVIASLAILYLVKFAADGIYRSRDLSPRGRLGALALLVAGSAFLFGAVWL